jgi:SNF2 family DNA or RNA helicase
MTGGEVVYTFPTNPKLDELSELINEMEGKYIIYHQYIYESVMIGELLKQKKIQYAMLNGEIQDKGKQIEQFINNDNCRCLVAHPKSGGEGLNLQCANTEIFFNNGFIGTILRNQSEGRIHRTGQKKNCLYIDLIAEGTVDEILYNSLKNNEDFVKNLLEYFHCRTKS